MDREERNCGCELDLSMRRPVSTKDRVFWGGGKGVGKAWEGIGVGQRGEIKPDGEV